MKLFVLGLALLTLQLSYVAESVKDAWTFHGENGPEQWKNSFPECNGKRQSPINIPIMKKEYQPKLRGSLHFSHYTCPCAGPFVLKNTGRTLKVGVWTAFASLTLKAKQRFMLDHVHFHWGSNNRIGSEHQFDGKNFSAEMHFVHYNIKYGNLAGAINKSDGLAVLGTMIKVGKENEAFTNFLNYSHKVQKPGQSFKIPSFDVASLLPSNVKHFYHYKGSLTTPPCVDTVTWTVFYTHIEISQEQADTNNLLNFGCSLCLLAHEIDKFRSLRDRAGEPLVNNFRPVQKLNGRTVKGSFRLFLE